MYSPYINHFLQPDTVIPDLSNPQAFNRYAYVQNSPINLSDPTGHFTCSSDKNSDDYCPGHSTSGGPTPPIQPADLSGKDDKDNKKKDDNKVQESDTPACGMSGYYSPKCPDWHFYTTTYMICPAEFDCTANEMRDYLSRYAFPGQDHSFPVVDAGIYPIKIVIPNTNYGFSLGNFPGRIRVSVSDDGMLSINRTLPGHIFYDGIAIRKVYQSNNGAWFVTTYSYGNNHQFHTAGVNNIFGPSIFENLDQEMQDDIAAHH